MVGGRLFIMHFFNRVFFRVALCAIIRNECSMGSLQYLNVHFFEDVFYCNLRCVWAQNKVKKSVPAPKIHNDVKCQYLIDKLLDLTNWLRNSEVSLCNPTSALSQLYWHTNNWDTLWSKITVWEFQKIPLKKGTAKTSWEIIILTSSIPLNLSILFNTPHSDYILCLICEVYKKVNRHFSNISCFLLSF